MLPLVRKQPLDLPHARVKLFKNMANHIIWKRYAQVVQQE